MPNVVGKVGFKVVNLAISIPVGIAVRKGVQKLWLSARPDDPPRKPTDPEVSWGDALGWAALSAAGVAVAELVSLKGAAEVYRFLSGSNPPVKQPKYVEPAKALKKVSVED
jgi:hypothetical protein